MEHNRNKPSCAVLVVEDEPFVRLMGVDFLEDAGFDVLQAGNADEALRVLESHPEVDVVFSDIEMPGALDGLGLARRICERWPNIGIVLTSGRHLRKEAMPRDGRFLPKPYAGSTLVREIKEALRSPGP
jgi:two-component system, response regulator PdtaR